GIEDATANSGQTYLAALNGTASGGGYELALACDHIMLVDDRSSAVSLPELPLLGVLPGTGGLTRVVDKRHVRRDRADYFSTKTDAPTDIRTLHEQGADFWTLALTRELDDLILDLRTNETELGTWVLRTEGEPARVLGYDRLLTEHGGDWLVNEIVHYLKLTLK